MATKGFKIILSFFIGFSIGMISDHLILKNKYETIAQEEIDSVKEHYSSRKSDDICEEKNTEPKKQNTNHSMKDIINYTNKLSDLGYNKTKYDSLKNEDETEHFDPYVISPDEFGELAGYDTVSFTYYSDGVLSDLHDNIINNDEIKNCIGNDFSNHFGEYEDDSVFIRNDLKKCDYEILYDERKWSDILASKPYLTEDE